MKKEWYNLRGVEYSTNFDFFIDNQIMVAKADGINLTFSSRLEPYTFKTIKTINSIAIEIEVDQVKEIREIHEKLLNGEYGQGKFID